MRLKSSSPELLHQMEQYLALDILWMRRFEFVKIKSLGLQIATP